MKNVILVIILLAGVAIAMAPELNELFTSRNSCSGRTRPKSKKPMK